MPAPLMALCKSKSLSLTSSDFGTLIIWVSPLRSKIQSLLPVSVVANKHWCLESSVGSSGAGFRSRYSAEATATNGFALFLYELSAGPSPGSLVTGIGTNYQIGSAAWSSAQGVTFRLKVTFGWDIR